jgi:hypothetical protein
MHSREEHLVADHVDVARDLDRQHTPGEGARQERDEEAVHALLSTEERDHLERCGYVWRRELGVVWRDPEGRWRRQQFTHGAYFRGSHGLSYIDSGGQVRAVADAAP